MTLGLQRLEPNKNPINFTYVWDTLTSLASIPVEMQDHNNNVEKQSSRAFFLPNLRFAVVATCTILLIGRNFNSGRALAALNFAVDDWAVVDEEQQDNAVTVVGGSASRRISYTMRRGDSYNMTFAASAYRCPLGNAIDKFGNPKWFREPLLKSLQPHLNFTTFVQTNLRILVLGDSVAIQLGQLLEEVLGVIPSSRHVLHESWHRHEGLTVSATSGGGAIAHFRLTGMLLAKGEGQPIPNHGYGWNRTHVNRLMQHRHLINGDDSNLDEPGFDVMIFRVSHGWLKFSDITEASVRETIQLAQELFRVKKIILLNLPFNNNIKSHEGLQDWKRTNAMLDRVAVAYPSELTGNVQVSVLQFAQWTNLLTFQNAKAIGWNTTDAAGNPDESYVLDRLGCKKQHPISIAQGCAEKATKGDCQCNRNRVSQDGMHWCLESLGGRLSAGLACLMTCFQDDLENGGLTGGAIELRACEAQCNDQYMSLRPLEI